jgi:hypothetical protein
MSHHLSHHHSSETNEGKTKKSEFVNWLDANSSFFWTQFIAALGFLGVTLEIVVHFHEIMKENKAGEMPHYMVISIFVLQAIFILLVIFFLNHKSFEEKIYYDRYELYHSIILKCPPTQAEAQAASKVNDINISLFARHWLLFWKLIFLLYLTLALRQFIGPQLRDDPAYFICSNTLETFFNNISMANLLICFLLIQSPLSSLGYNIKTINRQLDQFIRNKTLIYTVVIGFSFVQLCVLFLLRDHIDTDGTEANKVFKILSGIFNCFCLAILVARLDSKIANVPSNLISILIIYAALQPLYVFFDEEKNTILILVVSAFTLCFKVYFYIIVAYIINTGRLADLFFTFPLIKKMIEQDGYKTPDPLASTSKDPEAFSKHLDKMYLVLLASGFGTKNFKNKNASLSE